MSRTANSRLFHTVRQSRSSEVWLTSTLLATGYFQQIQTIAVVNFEYLLPSPCTTHERVVLAWRHTVGLCDCLSVCPKIGRMSRSCSYSSTMNPFKLPNLYSVTYIIPTTGSLAALQILFSLGRRYAGAAAWTHVHTRTCILKVTHFVLKASGRCAEVLLMASATVTNQPALGPILHEGRSVPPPRSSPQVRPTSVTGGN